MYTSRDLDRIRNKRNGRTRKIIAWLMIILGLETIVVPIFGIILLSKTKKQVKLWDRYEAVINKRGNTSFDYIGSQLGKSDMDIIEDLRVMIENGFFIGPNCDIDAIIDTKRRYLVMTRNGEQMEAFIKHEERKEPEPSKQELTYIDRIREIIGKTSDEEFRNSLYYLEEAIRRIESRIEKDPQLALDEDIIKFEEFYLPQTYELIEKYHKKEGSPETLEKIKDTLRVCAEAFRGIENKIVSENDIDTIGDIAVLKNAFESGGLLEGVR